MVLLCFTLPTVVPWYFWNESIVISFFIPAILRYTIGLNATWLVNSAAHMFGNRPYDQNINPRENPLVSLGALGTFSVHVFHFLGAVAVHGNFCESRCPHFSCNLPLQPCSFCMWGCFPNWSLST